MCRGDGVNKEITRIGCGVRYHLHDMVYIHNHAYAPQELNDRRDEG